MLDDLLQGLLCVGGLLFFAAILFLRYQRSGSILEGWADANGYRIVRSEYCTFFRGPFFLTTTKNQAVYRVSPCVIVTVSYGQAG